MRIIVITVTIMIQINPSIQICKDMSTTPVSIFKSSETITLLFVADSLFYIIEFNPMRSGFYRDGSLIGNPPQSFDEVTGHSRCISNYHLYFLSYISEHHQIHASRLNNFLGHGFSMNIDRGNPREVLHNAAFEHSIPASVGDSRKYCESKIQSLIRSILWLKLLSFISKDLKEFTHLNQTITAMDI